MLACLKTPPERIELVLTLLAEGVDIAVLVRVFGHGEDTIARWLERAGNHAALLHDLNFHELAIDHLQLDELYAKVRQAPDKHWLWVAIDPLTKIVPSVWFGKRTTADAHHFGNVKPVVCTSGDASRAPIRAAARSAISGRRISASLRRTAIKRPGKTAVKPTISSAGSIPCASAWRGLFAKPCLFPSPTVFMSLFFGYSFITTIESASVNSSPLPSSDRLIRTS